jgi:sugar lactone lactonase YvrE
VGGVTRTWATPAGLGSGLARAIGLLGLLALVSLGAASRAAAATACTWNPVCPYQGLRVLGGTDASSLAGPLAVALTPGGDVVVGDRGAESVREFTATGQLVQYIGTPGSYQDENGVAVDPTSGEIWVSDEMGVHGFTADGTPEATATGNGVGPFQTDGIAVAPNGTLYAFNGDTSTIYSYSPAGTVLSMLPAPGVIPDNSGDAPVAMAVDSEGDVYLADIDSEKVTEVSPAGIEVATLSVPSVMSLAVSGSTLYVQSEWGEGAQIRTYDLSGGLTGGFVDSGLADSDEDGGATFAVGPSGIVAVTTDHTIQELDLGGTVTGSWGGLAADDFDVGAAVADSAGDIYVVDSENDRVIRYDAQGDPPTVFADLSEYGVPSQAAINAQGDLVVQTGSDQVTLGPGGSVVSVAPGCCAAVTGTWPAGVPLSQYYAVNAAGDAYAESGWGTATASDITVYSPTGRVLGAFDIDAYWFGGLPGPIAVDAQDNIYVATGADIREFNSTGTLVAVWKTPAPATSLSVGANGDVYAGMGAALVIFENFLDPLPPVPPQSTNPMSQSAQASVRQVDAELAAVAQSAAGSVKAAIACTGSTGSLCTGKLVLSAKTTLLGSKAFSIPSGQRASETIKLDNAARRLLAKRGKLDAVLTASYQSEAGGSTIKASRKLVLRGRKRARR